MRLRRELRNARLLAPVAAVLIVISLAAVASAFDCPEISFFRVGDKFASIGWTMNQDERDIEDFGGYRLWMREVWKSEEFSLVREFVLDEDDPQAAGYWPFPEYWQQPVRADSGDIFQNAFPYEFSVTAFRASDPNAVDYECLEANRTGIVYPRVGTRTTLAGIQCIPNPYRASADWEYGGQRRVMFVGLPEKATIRIFTVSASHVRTLIHDDPESDLEPWDLRNDDGEDIAPGVYFFHVDAGELGTTEGKVMIIK